MTTDISDLYFNYDEEKKDDNIKYYAFAISRENTDSIMIKYVLCSDSNVEEKIASYPYQKGLSGITWNGFHVGIRSQSIEKCTENCANLNSMLDPNGKVPDNEPFYFVLYKVSQIDETYEKTFLKMLFGQLTNDYKIINYVISTYPDNENNVLDEIQRKKEIAGNTAIQKALATAIDTAKQMKREIDRMKFDSEAERQKNIQLANEKAEQAIQQTVSNDKLKEYDKITTKLKASEQHNQLIAKNRAAEKIAAKQKKALEKIPTDDGVKESTLKSDLRSSKSASSIFSTSPYRPSTISRRQSAPNVLDDSSHHITLARKSKHPHPTLHHSQSSPDVLNVQQKQSPPESDPDSDSDSDLSILDIAELQNFPETKIIETKIIPDSNLDVPTQSEDYYDYDHWKNRVP
jgi:chemotaxis protein histidine kinase CheA